MLVDTLLHRPLFFSKNMYEKRVSAEDRAAFAELSYNDHIFIAPSHPSRR